MENRLYEYHLAYYVENRYSSLDVLYDQILAHNSKEARSECAKRHEVPKSHVIRARRGASYDCILSARAHGCY